MLSLCLAFFCLGFQKLVEVWKAKNKDLYRFVVVTNIMCTTRCIETENEMNRIAFLIVGVPCLTTNTQTTTVLNEMMILNKKKKQQKLTHQWIVPLSKQTAGEHSTDCAPTFKMHAKQPTPIQTLVALATPCGRLEDWGYAYVYVRCWWQLWIGRVFWFSTTTPHSRQHPKFSI